MNVSEAVRTKHAVRLFKPDAVPDDVVMQILDAGRRSQSSKNTQPWEFLIVRSRETLTTLSTMGKYAGHLAGANFAVLLVGSRGEMWNGFDWKSFDIGQASSYLQLAAWELGVGSCIATIHEVDQARALLGVPADRTLSVALSFGYPAADWVNAKMGGRKSIEAITHRERW